MKKIVEWNISELLQKKLAAIHASLSMWIYKLIPVQFQSLKLRDQIDLLINCNSLFFFHLSLYTVSVISFVNSFY